jgi:hypothetical protein
VDQRRTLAAQRREIEALTPAEVNAALRKWINPDALRIVMVTSDGAALRRELVSGAPSPIHYDSPVPAEVLAEEKRIEALPLGLGEGDVRVVPSTALFE